MTTPPLKAEVEAIVDSYLVHGVLPDQSKHRDKLLQLAREVAMATERRPAPYPLPYNLLRSALGELLDALPPHRDWPSQQAEAILRAFRNPAPHTIPALESPESIFHDIQFWDLLKRWSRSPPGAMTAPIGRLLAGYIDQRQAAAVANALRDTNNQQEPK